MGFTYSSSSPTASEYPVGLTDSAYINREPIVAITTDDDDNILVTVSNLRTTTPSPTNYGVYISGFTTGMAARDSWIDGDPDTGAYVVTYAGTTKLETLSVHDFSFSSVAKYSGVQLIGNPAKNNVVGTLSVEFSVVSPIPSSGSLVLELPFQNKFYLEQNLGITPPVTMVPSSRQVSATGSYFVSFSFLLAGRTRRAGSSPPR